MKGSDLESSMKFLILGSSCLLGTCSDQVSFHGSRLNLTLTDLDVVCFGVTLQVVVFTITVNPYVSIIIIRRFILFCLCFCFGFSVNSTSLCVSFSPFFVVL